jgi:hypothetical protein
MSSPFELRMSRVLFLGGKDLNPEMETHFLPRLNKPENEKGPRGPFLHGQYIVRL